MKQVIPVVEGELNNDFEEVQAMVESEPVETVIRDPAAVDPRNILPENSKRRRSVRFSLP